MTASYLNDYASTVTSGTSIAAAHVTGVVAMILQVRTFTATCHGWHGGTATDDSNCSMLNLNCSDSLNIMKIQLVIAIFMRL